eukprot:3640693-Rhodomonas_salina.1
MARGDVVGGQGKGRDAWAGPVLSGLQVGIVLFPLTSALAAAVTVNHARTANAHWQQAESGARGGERGCPGAG